LLLVAPVVVLGAGVWRAVAAPVITEFPLPKVNSAPRDITAGPDGNLWFAENGSVGRITPAGVVTEFAVSGGSSSGITPGPDGNLWFTQQNANRISRITPAGAITDFALPTAGSEPAKIAAGPDGNLWFTERIGNRIGRITTAGAITEFAVPTAGSQPWGIASGPDGNLWFTEINADKIGRITPTGAVTEFVLPAAASDPRGITAGPDGNLWFTEVSRGIGRITPTGTITEFPLTTPPTVGPEPFWITPGPDGNLWFTEHLGNKIGQITPTGTVTEFALPPVVIGGVASSGPEGITAGPDGNIWFTELLADKIGRLTLAAAPPPPVPGLDHFQCYKVDPTSAFRPRAVTLSDQFGVLRASAVRMLSLCAPVKKNNEPSPHNPRAHLACYGLDVRQPFATRTVVVTNQFQRAARLVVVKPVQLCLPSGKSLQPNVTPKPVKGLDHYECYTVKPVTQFRPTTVVLSDQFGRARRVAARASMLCNPVKKNGSVVLNKTDHLVCYVLQASAPIQSRRASLINQFGRSTLVVGQPMLLCVPSLKT
jgi:streptogramin lyase